MFQITGSYAEADILCDSISDTLRDGIKDICNDRVSIGSNPIVMPNAQYRYGIIDGLIMNISSDRLSPNIISTDIGCGILCSKVKCKGIPDLDKLDYVIKNVIPCGTKIRKTKLSNIAYNKLLSSRILQCSKNVDMSLCINSIGTLGGGEHYIQLAESKDGYYLIIHTGSRLYAKYTFRYYSSLYNRKRDLTEISKGNMFDCMDLARDANTLYYIAYCNRATISNIIAANMGWSCEAILDKTHDSIDIIRNGYTIKNNVQSAHPGSKVIIPTNIVDGIILGTATDDSSKYMNAAPGSSGRKFSRAEMKNKYTLSDYKRSMKNIYCTTISESNIHTAPMAYNSLNYIKEATPWVKIDKVLKPVYIFKPST